MKNKIISVIKKKGNITIILTVCLLFVAIIFIGYFYWRARIFESTKKLTNIIPTAQYTSPAISELSSKDEFVNWKIYTDNKYGFEFKYPPDFPLEKRKEESSEKQYLLLTGFYGELKIIPEQQGLGFENPNAEITYQPLLINGKKVSLGGKNIEKIKIFEKFAQTTKTSYAVIIPYPDKREYSIMGKYYFFNGADDKNNENRIHKILSSFTFFNPGEFSVLNPSGITTFKSKLLTLSFRYPSSWGQVEETIRPGTTGNAYNLTFNGDIGNSALGFGSITAGGRSKDFSEGRGGYIADTARGFSSPQEFCDSYFGKQGASCETINQNIVVQLVVPKYEDVCPPNPGQYGFSKRVWVNLSGQEVDGFMLEYSNFWSKQFTEMSSTDLDCSKTKEDFEAIVSVITEKLKNRSLDQTTKTNLEGFDTFVKSIVLN